MFIILGVFMVYYNKIEILSNLNRLQSITNGKTWFSRMSNQMVVYIFIF